ncbi:MAG: hypothetical protein E7571_06390 [Ruminococcaceae bacterium]|nr:hypothetical protein [Oscillospiraceae bacterium]
MIYIKFSKKILAAVLAVLMAVSMMPFTAFATEWTDENVWGHDLQTGDILTSDVHYVEGLEVYTLTLQAGGYYCDDSEEVANSDLVTTEWRTDWYETSSGTTLIICDNTDGSMYFPYDANGITNQWYVIDVDHENETITLSGQNPQATPALAPVSYKAAAYDTDSNTVTYTDATCDDYTVVAADTTTFEDGKWYVVNSNVTVNGRITVNGAANLILADGYTLTVTDGVAVTDPNSLTIYGQENGTGTLTATSTSYGAAGIGGNDGENGPITINGGTVNATSGSAGAGIGGGEMGNGGPVVINGGTVTAIGGEDDGAGIGSGGNGSSCNVTINGGTVNATGRHTYDNTAGIGNSGWSSNGGNIAINGGTVNAACAAGSQGIGGSGCTISITGGTVDVNRGVTDASYGLFGSSFTMSGGEVYVNRSVYVNTTITGGTLIAEGNPPFQSDVSIGTGLKVLAGDNEESAVEVEPSAINMSSGVYWNSKWIKIYPAPVYTDGFMVGDDHYDTFAEALEAAQSGDTITFLEDIDFRESYPWGTAHYIDISGITLDLNLHQIDVQNFGVIWTGQNFTIKNGTFVGEKRNSTSYGLHVYGKDNTTDSLGDLPQAADVPVKNAVLEDLTIVGGANIWYAENVVLKNCEVTGQNYYAVWANYGSDVTIESGTYTSDCVKTNGVLGAQSNSDAGGLLKVTGGDVTVPANKNLVYNKSGDVDISGGTYNVVVPQKYCANGYVPVTEVDEQGKYTVEKAREDGFNLSINDMIHMNLYVNVDDYKGDTVVITYNDPDAQTPTATTDTYTGSALTELKDAQDGRYVISVLAAPAQIKDEVTVQVKKNGSVVHTFTTTVATYCKTIIAESNDGALVNLAKAMLDYGKACSDEFNYNEDAFSEQAYYNTEDASHYIEAYGYLNSDNANGQFAGYAYIAKSVPALRIYLNTTEEEVVRSGLTATVNGEAAEITVVEGTDKVCVDITGIKAEDLDAEYTITFNGGTLTLNALQYAKAKGGNTDFSRSMYNYSQAATFYFD